MNHKNTRDAVIRTLSYIQKSILPKEDTYISDNNTDSKFKDNSNKAKQKIFREPASTLATGFPTEPHIFKNVATE